MRDVGYITAGFLITSGVVGGYLASLRSRVRHAWRAYRIQANGEPR